MSRNFIFHLFFLLLNSTHVFAKGCDENDLFIKFGFLNLKPNTHSGTLHQSYYNGQSTGINNTGVKVGSSSTAQLSIGKKISGNIYFEIMSGLPPTFKVTGDKRISNLGHIVKTQAWLPTFISSYHFGNEGDVFRPYFSLGVNYTWFKRSHLTNDKLDAALGGNSSVEIKDSWSAVYGGGVKINLTDNTGLDFSFMYIPLNVKGYIYNGKKNYPSDYLDLKTKLNITATSLTLYYDF
ncbi:OmpW/AlkL family protein [Serratia marcescens]|uniref:OmpW/AlkL family protein n=1 Tax=Serratia marcescens TaxID=615 RepID=UPI00398A1583